MRRAEGSIVKYGDRYRVFVTTDKGRTSKTVKGSKRDAERELRRLLRSTPAEYTIGELAEDYVDSLRSRQANGELSPSTVREYIYIIESRIAPEFGELRADFLKPARVRQFVESLPANRRSVFKTFRQMMNWGERNELIESNPFRKLQAPKPPRTITREEVYTAEEVRRIMAELEGEEPYLRIGALIAIGGGLRRGEICALDWSDLRDGTVTVSKSYGKDRPKTANGNRSVRLPDALSGAIEEFRGVGPMLAYRGERVAPDGLTHAWRSFCKRKGIRYLPLKNLRHTSLTLAYEASGDIYAVSRRAGHAGIAITTKFYARPDKRIDEAVAEGLNGVFACERVRTRAKEP